MKMTSLLAGLGLLATPAIASETTASSSVEVKQDKDHTKIEKVRKRGRSADKTTVESKSRHRAGGGTVSTTETTRAHERPGLGNDSKTKATETVERDAAGNVVRHEKKIEK